MSVTGPLTNLRWPSVGWLARSFNSGEDPRRTIRPHSVVQAISLQTPRRNWTKLLVRVWAWYTPRHGPATAITGAVVRSAQRYDVCREERARACHPAVDEPKRLERAAGGEVPFAAAHDEWVDHHPVPVHEIVLNQCFHELSAADYVKIPAVLLLQLEHGLDDVAVEHRRVFPFEWLGERPRGHILGLLCSVAGR
jgi:hypothetical protein